MTPSICLPSRKLQHSSPRGRRIFSFRASSESDSLHQPRPHALPTIQRRDLTERNVQIDIRFCGICHSDLHTVRNEWSEMIPTTYPVVAGHEIVGRVTAVGSAVSKYKEGDLVGVGCLVDSDGTCEICLSGLEQFCPNAIYTYAAPDRHLGGTTHGGYSEMIVVDERFVLRIPENLDPAAAAPLLCAGITTYSPLRAAGVTKGMKVGVVGLGGLGHMGVKLAKAFGAHVVAFTTTPGKREDAMRLGADEVVVSTNPDEMQKHAGTFHFILDTVSAEHDVAAYLALLRVTGRMTLVGAPSKPLPVPAFALIMVTAPSPDPTSAASPKPRKCSTSAANTTSPPTSK